MRLGLLLIEAEADPETNPVSNVPSRRDTSDDGANGEPHLTSQDGIRRHEPNGIGHL